jgi:hypothetical protein
MEVQMSKIKSIKRCVIEDEKLYNLAVMEDESFIGDGVVLHNCRSVLIPITIYENPKFDKTVDGQNIDKFIEENIGDGFAKK